MRILGTALLAVAGGLLMTLALLFLGPNPVPRFHLPVGWAMTDPGHVDLWTGEVRPIKLVAPIYGESGQITSTRTHEIPENWRDVRAIPLPVAFVAGGLLALTVITIVSRRPRRVAPTPVVPAASVTVNR